MAAQGDDLRLDRVRPSRRQRLLERRLAQGWALSAEVERDGRKELTFRRAPGTSGRRSHLGLVAAGAAVVAAALVGCLVIALLQRVDAPTSAAERAADRAAADLGEHDLAAVGRILQQHRGDEAFAARFADRASAQDVGLTLGRAGGRRGLAADIDPETYEATLTDLAGVLALASQVTGSGEAGWATRFVEASVPSRDERSDDDEAIAQNLLLVLSRGYWSQAFLEDVARAYLAADRSADGKAWPAEAQHGVGFAPSPEGVYLGDGMLALTAALTANPAAAAWAFDHLLPGTQDIPSSDVRIGRFTHHLVFDHRYPVGSDDENIGMGATLTALSASIDAGSGGARRDSRALQGYVDDLADEADCSWDPRDYLQCAKNAIAAIGRAVGRWGHTVLGVVSLTAGVLPPLGGTAAVVNAAWYAVEEDYVGAGLALAAVVPGLGFAKVAKSAKTARFLYGVTSKVKPLANVVRSSATALRTKLWRVKAWKDCDAARAAGGIVLHFKPGWTRKDRADAVRKVAVMSRAASKGELVKTKVARAPNTKQAYEKATGRTVRPGHDVDHTVEKQLGGSDSIDNLRELRRTVNASFGTQIRIAIKDLEYGDKIPAIAICRP